MYAAIGVIFVVAGAILTFAVDKSVEGVDLDVIGWILMGGGALSLLVAAIQGAGWMSMSKTRLHTERHASDDGQHYVEETRTG
jgi:hypothetical protein